MFKIKQISRLSKNKYWVQHGAECNMANIFQVSHILQYTSREMFAIFHKTVVR